MKKYIVHYYINGHILCREIEADNVLAVTGVACTQLGIHLDQVIAVNEKPFMLRVIHHIKALGGNGAHIPDSR